MNSLSDIALLPALDALLSEANITRAAARMGMSQPSLSAKLARLRLLTGDQLLVPSGDGRGMVLTPRALALHAQVREALASACAALSTSPGFDPTTSQITLRIIANDNAAALTLALMVTEMAEKGARSIRVSLLRPDDRLVADRLASGDADIAIGLDKPIPGADRLHRRPILHDGYLTAQRKGHPRGKRALDLDGFCAESHLLVSQDGKLFSGVVDGQLREMGRTRHVALSIHSYALAPMVVARSNLLTTLPRRLLEQHAERLDLFEPPLDLGTFTAIALWHDRTHDDPANRWLRERLFATSPD